MTGSDFAGEFNSENEKDECRQGLRQVVVFEIGDQPFAVNVESVREIIRWQGVREIPQTPRSLMGVSTIRGEVLPVIDLAAFFEIQDSIPAEQKILIVLEMGENGLRTGVAVDSVKRIFSITTEQMDSTLKGAFIGENLHCVVKHGEINVLMPDFERIINAFKL
ncbi:MAG: chemotaxis protein CheW, partial [Synergistota bacterium]|nr:chemotaxis protein CheW [Synergistota bacterium]